MTSVSLGKKRFLSGGIAFAAALILVGMPIVTAASTVLPMQALPPATQTSCAPVTFSDIVPYIYERHLDSFDITLSDASYVAVATTVDNRPVAFSYISRWQNADGTLRMHVDLQPTDLITDVLVQITFLSAHNDSGGNAVTCIFNVPARIAAVAQPQGPADKSSVSKPAPTTLKPGPVSTSSMPETRNPGLVSATSSLGNLCADGGASRLWMVLMVLYVLLVFTLCAQDAAPDSRMRQWNIGLILAVFLGLLIFWYVSAACRTGPWAPIVATLIAIAGLLYTMLRPNGVQQILLLRDGKDQKKK